MCRQRRKVVGVVVLMASGGRPSVAHLHACTYLEVLMYRYFALGCGSYEANWDFACDGRHHMEACKRQIAVDDAAAHDDDEIRLGPADRIATQG